MSWLTRLFGEDSQTVPVPQPHGDVDLVPAEPEVEQSDSTLDLGWYWSENKEEVQMAKIAQKDRATHMYVIGATGTGKTKFLEYLIQQDIRKGDGFGVIDPHGDLIESIKGSLAYYLDEEDVAERVVLIDPLDARFTVTFNPLEKLPNTSVPEQASELISAFKKIWSDSWGVRMEDLMRNSLIALGETDHTLADLSGFLTHRRFRESILQNITHPITREYFQRFEGLTDRSQVSWIEPIMNKINAFLSDERIREMFSSPQSSFNLRDVMDNRKILLVKLNKGKLKGSTDLLGSLVMSMIQMAAFSRSELPMDRRIPFYLYIDEFQNFAGESFSVVLSEARKYRLSLIMAHQTLAQIPEELRSLILGNTGVQVYFRVNRHDASLLAREAFEYSGYEVKSVHIYEGPDYWSLGEEWEHYTEALQTLPPRVCFVKHKIEGGMIPLKTAEIESASEALGLEEEECARLLNGYPFGRRYLVEREAVRALADSGQKSIGEAELPSPERGKPTVPKTSKEPEEKPSEQPALSEKPQRTSLEDEVSPEEKVFLDFISRHPGKFITQVYKALQLSGYKGDRLNKALVEKGLLDIHETREGRKGRLAKLPVLTEKAASLLKKSGPVGKGGDLHRHLQATIKEQAELYGWKAVIEERIPKSLETVDIGLRKDEVRVAVEISSTTRADQEIQNIRKCLDAGYDYVVAVSSDEKSLTSLKTGVKSAFTMKERERIRFYEPSAVKGFLKTIGTPVIVSENTIVSGQISKQKLLLNMDEAAEYLGIKKTTLYEWVVQKKIPYIKVGRLTKFKREDLDSWLTKRTQQESDRDFS